MEYDNKRKNDIKKTDIIANFCDKEIYDKLPFLIERNKNKGLDLMGVDLIWDGTYVDEKIASNYINRNLTTFAFELSSMNNKNSSGWFSENTYILTEYYLIGYLKGSFESQKFERVELLLISKKKLWKYLKEKNFPNGIVSGIRYGQITPSRTSEKGVESYSTGIYGVKVVHSTQLKESPINIVISKDILKKIATEIYIYENKNIKIIKKIKKS